MRRFRERQSRLMAAWETDDAVEDASLETLSGQFGEAPLDDIEPGDRSRGEPEMEPRMPFEPGPHLGILVCRVIVDDEMQVPLRRGRAVDVVQKSG
jgi:hypothetical protein